MPDILTLLAEALGPVMEQQKGRRFGLSLAEKHNAAAGVPGAVYSHGPGGMLTFPGIDPVVFNASMGAISIMSEIPVMPSQYANPTYYTLTGVDDVTGAEMSAVCDNAPVAGLMRGCMTTSVFGRYERATPKLEIPRLGLLVDRADPMDIRLIGSPIGDSGPFASVGGTAAPGDVLTNEVTRKFWERNIAMHRLLAKQFWVGNPSNNAGGGGYKEMTGLQLLVNTGYVDAETGSTCPAMDSYIVNNNYARIGASNSSLVGILTDAVYQLSRRAERAGVAPVRWMMAMRAQMFYELTNVWPCSYLTMGCNTDGLLRLDAQDAVRFRDEMRAGKYLLIDGQRIDVILDDGIPEKSGNDSGGSFPNGCFSSDIYILPMSIVGGQSTLFMEYLQYSNPAVEDALGKMVLGRIEGAWITWPRQTNMCVEWQSRIEPRLVLRTPWLASRIQNVVYCPTAHEPEPFPGDPYFGSGGASSRQGPSYHNLWS